MSSAIAVAPFVDNPNNQEYANVLVRVQQAICAGDDELAARLCDESADLAERLPISDVRWMQGLSSDLDFLCGTEMLRPYPMPRDRYAALLGQAWENYENDPNAYLSLLRYEQDVIASYAVAYTRSRAYGTLGIASVSLAFMRKAVELAPDNALYFFLLLNLLENQRGTEELNRVAQSLLENEAADPSFVIVAASYLFMSTRSMPAESARPTLGKVRRMLRSVFDNNPINTIDRHLWIMGMLALGSALSRLNRTAEAQRTYLQALKIVPDNQELLHLLASSLLKTSPEQAYPIFDRLVSMGTDHILPYLMAAQQAGTRGQYAECVRFCEIVLARTDNATICSYAYEFMGVSELQTNGPTDKAEESLRRAMKMNDTALMRDNYAEFERALNDQVAQSQEKLAVSSPKLALIKQKAGAWQVLDPELKLMDSAERLVSAGMKQARSSLEQFSRAI